MYFQYDTNESPLGFIYNGTQYFYITNQMGDVVGITDATGTLIAQYEYDEWGNVLSTSENDIANINPIRYRGYYQDAETGYYYLQSRYYDPNICRFINADISEIAQRYKNLHTGINIFSYCSNNPINLEDPDGYYSYSSLGKKGIKLLSKRLQKNINEMKKHSYKGFSLYDGKIRCVSAVHYTAYWYGTTLIYNMVTYEAKVKYWYSFIDDFKKVAKKVGIAQKTIDSSTFANLAAKILKKGKKKISIVTKALSITIDILMEIAKGIVDKVDQNIRHKSRNDKYRFNLYVVNIINGTFGNTSKTILYVYTSGVAVLI